MNIFYCEENKECINYMSNINTGFKYIEIEQGNTLELVNNRHKHIIFFMEGSANVGYNEHSCKTFSAGEMIFIPKLADFNGVTLTKCRLIIFIYDKPIKLCNKFWVEILACAKNVNFEFNSLPINHIVEQYLNLQHKYLLDDARCLYFHNIKHIELFYILRIYYRKEDLANFFFPVIDKSCNFRNDVMGNYLFARTVKELAGICNYSERQFRNLFINEFGEAPYTWMQKQKSKQILALLSDKDIQIKYIVMEFGFTCPSHFNKYCIRLFGLTPKKIREKLLLGDQIFSKIK